MKLIFAGFTWHVLAFALALVYMFSDNPDRDAYLFASVMLIIKGSTDRIIAHIKASAD